MQQESITLNGITYSIDCKTVIASDLGITSLSVLERGINTIGRGAFKCCHNLRIVHIPETVVRIEDFAFMDCVNIQELHLPRYVEYISPLAFIYSDNIIKSHFYYDIPKIVIPSETFFQYQFLIPYYIDVCECSRYGITMDDVEERDDFDFFKGLPSVIDEQEFFRMSVAINLQFEGTFAFGREICDYDCLTSLDDELLRILFDICCFLDDHKLENTKDNFIFKNIDITIDSIIISNINDNFNSTYGQSPYKLMELMLQESMYVGFSQPFIWEKFDDEEIIGDYYEYGFALYGHPVWGFYDSVISEDIDLRIWWEDMNIDFQKLLIAGISIYQEHGYMITSSLLRWIYRKLLMMVFYAGFTHGMNYRRASGHRIY